MNRIQSGLFLLLWSILSACSTSVSSAPDALRIRWARDPENLDPLIAKTPGSLEVNNLLHCSLLRADEKQGDFTPWLAEALPGVTRIGDSLMRVSYRIRPEATWDNGSPVLARDVAFTLKLMHCPGLPTEMAQARFGFVIDLLPDSTDPRGFSLLCRGQSIDFVRSSGDFSILPEYILDPQATLRGLAVADMGKNSPAVQELAKRYLAAQLARYPERMPGCGPYTLLSWQPGRQLTLTRKTTWWADKLSTPPPALRAFPRRISFQIIPDAATAVLALRRSDIDLYSLMPAPEFARLQQSHTDREQLRFYTADSYECLTVNFNTRKSLLQDRLTRQALTYLFDVPALIKATQLGQATPSVGLISPRIKQYYNDSLPALTYSPAQASRLLQQAGWQRSGQGWTRTSQKGPQQLRLSISYRSGEPTFETTALQFRAAAASLGIPIELRPTEASLLSRQLLQGEGEISLRNMSGQPFAYDFTPILHSGSTNLYNITGFGTPATDYLIETIAEENNLTKKAVLLRQFQRVLYIEKPLAVLYFLKYRIAASRRLGTVPVSGLMPGYIVTDVRPTPARP